jgi:hypothetical protein
MRMLPKRTTEPSKTEVKVTNLSPGFCPAILPAIAMPGLLLLFPLDCAGGGSARGGGKFVRRGRLIGEGELVRGDQEASWV